ncbi:hypothetical protein RJ639_042168 [Escallonia herrerae]|uniref:Post-SET domain-containing protein n=1 Tax=Escallonia herrerae TaxID=1293975 RepID=A0AA89B5B6_9ASTE|nr:hypothetical protein RJ639_042168 [Escallonia herrerae]
MSVLFTSTKIGFRLLALRWSQYAFFSIDEQLACSCGFPRCRGVVNDMEAEELVAKLYAPRSELIDWRGE